MVDYAADVHATLHGGPAPADFADKRAAVIARLKELQDAAAPVVAFLQDEAAVRGLGADKAANAAYLQAAHGIGPAQVESLYAYAKFQFDCGNYGAAAEFLYHYRQGRGGGWSGGVGAGAWARGRGRWDRPAQHSPSFPPLPCTARWAPTGST